MISKVWKYVGDMKRDLANQPKFNSIARLTIIGAGGLRKNFIFSYSPDTIG